jgi:hypothetical protein
MVALAAAGSLGDVLTSSASAGQPAVVYSKKITMALDALIARDKLDMKQWFAPLVEAAKVDGKQVAMIFNGKIARVAVFYNLRVDDVSKAINPFIEKIMKNEAQPTAGFMKEANDAVQRVLDLPREGV